MLLKTVANLCEFWCLGWMGKNTGYVDVPPCLQKFCLAPFEFLTRPASGTSQDCKRTTGWRLSPASYLRVPMSLIPDTII